MGELVEFHGKKIILPDKTPPIEQILGRKPTQFEEGLMQRNKGLSETLRQIQPKVVVKIFREDDLDENKNYQCVNVLMQPAMSLYARLEAVAKQRNMPIENVIAWLLTSGLDAAETALLEKKTEPETIQ